MPTPPIGGLFVLDASGIEEKFGKNGCCFVQTGYETVDSNGVDGIVNLLLSKIYAK